MYTPSREKAELLSAYRSAVGAEFERIVSSQLESALGCSSMIGRDPATGRWQPITDPAEMAERLNEGEHCYRITTRSGSSAMIKDILDRVLGMPAQQIEITSTHAPAQMSDQELRANLRDLLGRLDEPAVIDVEPVLVDGSGPAETLADPEVDGQP